MSGAVWDVVFVVVTVFGGLVGGLVAALSFAQARRDRNRPISRVAAVGVFLISALFSITAVLLFWWYFELAPISWQFFILGSSQSDITSIPNVP